MGRVSTSFLLPVAFDSAQGWNLIDVRFHLQIFDSSWYR